MTAPMKLFKSGPRGPHAASDGPSATLNATCNATQRVTLMLAQTISMAKTSDVAHSTNTCEMINVVSRRDVVHQSRWDPQILDLTKFFKKVLGRTMLASAASDGPSAACKTDVHHTRHMAEIRDEAQQADACERTNVNNT